MTKTDMAVSEQWATKCRTGLDTDHPFWMTAPTHYGVIVPCVPAFSLFVYINHSSNNEHCQLYVSVEQLMTWIDKLTFLIMTSENCNLACLMVEGAMSAMVSVLWTYLKYLQCFSGTLSLNRVCYRCISFPGWVELVCLLEYLKGLWETDHIYSAWPNIHSAVGRVENLKQVHQRV